MNTCIFVAHDEHEKRSDIINVSFFELKDNRHSLTMRKIYGENETKCKTNNSKLTLIQTDTNKPTLSNTFTENRCKKAFIWKSKIEIIRNENL